MKTRNRKSGFTLVELTVVVLIIGVLASIAAPKFFDSLTDAQDNSAASTVQVVRDAIELYKANNPAYPGADNNAATLKTDLLPFLRNGFPNCQVHLRDDSVKMENDGDALSLDVDELTSWIYDNTTGEFRINSATYIAL